MMFVRVMFALTLFLNIIPTTLQPFAVCAAAGAQGTRPRRLLKRRFPPLHDDVAAAPARVDDASSALEERGPALPLAARGPPGLFFHDPASWSHAQGPGAALGNDYCGAHSGAQPFRFCEEAVGPSYRAGTPLAQADWNLLMARHEVDAAPSCEEGPARRQQRLHDWHPPATAPGPTSASSSNSGPKTAASSGRPQSLARMIENEIPWRSPALTPGEGRLNSPAHRWWNAESAEQYFNLNPGMRLRPFEMLHEGYCALVLNASASDPLLSVRDSFTASSDQEEDEETDSHKSDSNDSSQNNIINESSSRDVRSAEKASSEGVPSQEEEEANSSSSSSTSSVQQTSTSSSSSCVEERKEQVRRDYCVRIAAAHVPHIVRFAQRDGDDRLRMSLRPHIRRVPAATQAMLKEKFEREKVRLTATLATAGTPLHDGYEEYYPRSLHLDEEHSKTPPQQKEGEDEDEDEDEDEEEDGETTRAPTYRKTRDSTLRTSSTLFSTNNASCNEEEVRWQELEEALDLLEEPAYCSAHARNQDNYSWLTRYNLGRRASSTSRSGTAGLEEAPVVAPQSTKEREEMPFPDWPQDRRVEALESVYINDAHARLPAGGPAGSRRPAGDFAQGSTCF